MCSASSTESTSAPAQPQQSSPHHYSCTPSPQVGAMNPDTFVRISSVLDGRFLIAADDGRSVRLDARQASYNAVWRVEQHLLNDGEGIPTPRLLLRGAYGRYLGALESQSSYFPCLQVVAAQQDFNEPEVRSISWRCQVYSGIRLLSATGSFLQNVSAGRSLSMAESWKASLWNVDTCPTVPRPQPMITAKPMWVKLLSYLPWRCSFERKVNWVLADKDGNIEEASWALPLTFAGRNIASLEKELGKLVIRPTTLCVRAGRYGKATPLLINLPRNREPIHVILFLKDTAGNDALLYPDVNHGVGRVEMARHGNQS